MHLWLELFLIFQWIILSACTVESPFSRISDVEGSFSGTVANYEAFGKGVASIGDLDGDGVIDLAVGAPLARSGGIAYGKVWILFLFQDGTVKETSAEITLSSGGFTGTLEEGDNFGYHISNLGDLDGDNVTDIAVGAYGTGTKGGIWILFLNTDGTVKDQQQIADGVGGLAGPLEASSDFGKSVCAIGDLDGDKIVDLAVGADFQNGDGGGSNSGAIWILFLNTDGTVKNEYLILDIEPAFGGTIGTNYFLGKAVSPIGDFDKDGTLDLAIGSGGSGNAVWILLLNTNGSVKDYHKISGTSFNLTNAEGFGISISSYGDLDGDGVTDLIVGSDLVSDGASQSGGLWVIFMNQDGTVKGQEGLSNARGFTSGLLLASDKFGSSVSAMGDFKGNGKLTVAVGAPGTDAGGISRGGLWILYFDLFISTPLETTFQMDTSSIEETTIEPSTTAETTVPETTNAETTVESSTTSESTTLETTLDLSTTAESTIIETTIEPSTTAETTVPQTTNAETTVEPSIMQEETTVEIPTTAEIIEDTTYQPTTFIEPTLEPSSITIGTDISQSEATTDISNTVTNSDIECISRNDLCRFSYCTCEVDVIVLDAANISNTLLVFLGNFKTQHVILFDTVTATFIDTKATFYQLEMTRSTLKMDLKSIINIERTLFLTDSNLIVDITKEEKEEIPVEGKEIIKIKGDIIGEFDSVTILVDHKTDSSVYIQKKEKNYVIHRKRSLWWIVLILALIAIIVFISIILTNERIKALIIDCKVDTVPSMVIQKTFSH